MNKVILVGRLTRDPEVKTTQNQVEVCSFTVAVDRRFKTASGERQSDFINCVAWRQQAKLLGQYFQKGHRIGIIGNLQSRSYDDKDGKKVYVTEVSVDEIEFLEPRKEGASSVSEDRSYNSPAPMSPNSGSDSVFMPTMDDDTALPFDL